MNNNDLDVIKGNLGTFFEKPVQAINGIDIAMLYQNINQLIQIAENNDDKNDKSQK